MRRPVLDTSRRVGVRFLRSMRCGEHDDRKGHHYYTPMPRPAKPEYSSDDPCGHHARRQIMTLTPNRLIQFPHLTRQQPFHPSLARNGHHNTLFRANPHLYASRYSMLIGPGYLQITWLLMEK